MKHYLVTWQDNWADEMDLEGFAIMTQDGWDKYEEVYTNALKLGTVTLGFGTNESNEYDEEAHFFSCLHKQEITPQDVDRLSGFFGLELDHSCRCYGFFPTLETALEHIEDAQDEEDE
jgi:hypothetical protein